MDPDPAVSYYQPGSGFIKFRSGSRSIKNIQIRIPNPVIHNSKVTSDLEFLKNIVHNSLHIWYSKKKSLKRKVPETMKFEMGN